MRAKWHDEAMKEFAGAGATGVVISPYDTNLGIAKRDYSKPCLIDHKYEMGQPQGCLVLYNGYWIWWCKTHYQPLPWCDVGRLREKLAKLGVRED